MPSYLRKLDIDEISVVESGANQRADILLFKSEPPRNMTLLELGGALAYLRQSAVAKDDAGVGLTDVAAAGPVAFDPVTPTVALIKAGYAQEVRKVFEASHAVYDDRYRFQGDPQAWATPHEED
jgi:hypothetical protein